ncbi:ABC transporter permease subunit [Enterobacter hormaechei]
MPLLRSTFGRGIAWGGVSLIFSPLLPGLWLMLSPAFHGDSWLAFWLDGQWRQALIATLTSSLIGSVGALLLCLLVIVGIYPGKAWQRYQRRLPMLLAVPHVAFATGSLFLFAPTGWLARLGLGSLTDGDPHAIGLGIILALKESWFLLWIAGALLKRTDLQRQLTIAHTLGYGRWHSAFVILLPQLLPQLAWALLAVTAYSISLVDTAIILGPGNPPTLAVLAWQWLNEPDIQIQAKGTIAVLLLTAILAALSLCGYAFWRLLHYCPLPITGRRYGGTAKRLLSGLAMMMTTIGYLVLLLLLLWSVAGSWFYPRLLPEVWSVVGWSRGDYASLLTTFTLGGVASLCGLIIVVAWLEWGDVRRGQFLWLPLLLPALPLAMGQYEVLLRLGLDGTFSGVVWSHLLWVVPYMLLILEPAYRHLDTRLLVAARSLGLSDWRVLLRVKWPLLSRPLLAAVAIGFSVTVAQYFPTLYAGAGRFATVTTETVALSGSGDPRALAVHALLQLLLPGCVFFMAVSLSRLVGHYRRGLR